MLPVKLLGIFFRRSSAASVCWLCKARCTACAQGNEHARAESIPCLSASYLQGWYWIIVQNNYQQFLLDTWRAFLSEMSFLPTSFHSLPFFPAMKDFSKIICLAKSDAFLITVLRHRHNACTFMCKKGRYQDARCFEGRVREDKSEDCWQRKTDVQSSELSY